MNGSVYLWSPSAGPRMQTACQEERRRSATGNRREPSLFQGQPSPMGAAHDKGCHILQPPRGMGTAPSPAPGEAPTHVLLFLHLSRAPHTNLSTLRRQDFKEEEETSFFWEVCFHRPLNSVHRGFFHLWFFVFHSYSFLRHQALADIKCLVCPEWPFIHK